MKRALFITTIFSLLFSPAMVWASPGQLDQYGGHDCQKNCLIYGLENGEYHFHEIPDSPSFLSGYLAAGLIEKLFYMPKVKADETTKVPAFMVNNELNTLTENIIYDNQLCKDVELFASGRYTSDPKVRISPVCAQRLINVLKNATINSNTDYYKSLPNVNLEITKAYHVQILNDGKTIFTDMPEIVELKGLIIQGATDTSLYYVNSNDENLALRPITAEKAIQLKGVNYKMGIAYFDDSIVYSYPIARPLL
jgi:hypothetical protein